MKPIRNTKAPTETQKEHKAKGRERDKQNEEKGHGSGTSIASLQALLSIASSLEIFHSFKSLNRLVPSQIRSASTSLHIIISL